MVIGSRPSDVLGIIQFTAERPFGPVLTQIFVNEVLGQGIDT